MIKFIGGLFAGLLLGAAAVSVIVINSINEDE